MRVLLLWCECLSLARVYLNNRVVTKCIDIVLLVRSSHKHDQDLFLSHILSAIYFELVACLTDSHIHPNFSSFSSFLSIDRRQRISFALVFIPIAGDTITSPRQGSFIYNRSHQKSSIDLLTNIPRRLFLELNSLEQHSHLSDRFEIGRSIRFLDEVM